jgi:hypothetical protein
LEFVKPKELIYLQFIMIWRHFGIITGGTLPCDTDIFARSYLNSLEWDDITEGYTGPFLLDLFGKFNIDEQLL